MNGYTVVNQFMLFSKHQQISRMVLLQSRKSGRRLTCNGGGDESSGNIRNRTIREKRFEDIAAEQKALDGVSADADKEEIGPDVEKAGKTTVEDTHVGVKST